MAILLIIYFVLGIGALYLQYLLYQKDAKRYVYILNMVFGFLLTYIAYSSLPSNYIVQKGIALIFGLSGASSIFVKERTNHPLIPKVMLSVSIIGNLILLLI